MSRILKSNLNPKKRYLQIALNSTLEDAKKIIENMPLSDKIILEAGTPLIKRYGEDGIRQIRLWHEKRLKSSNQTRNLSSYIAADLKTMDRGDTEVKIAANAGAKAAIALGIAPIETLNTFIEACEALGIDAMIDMMNVEFPLSVLRQLKKIPPIVILHRGVDEERLNKEKMLPLHEIRRIKGNYNIMISVAGGDSAHEIQSAVFNDADIIVIWKSVYESTNKTIEIVEEFLKKVK